MTIRRTPLKLRWERAQQIDPSRCELLVEADLRSTQNGCVVYLGDRGKTTTLADMSYGVAYPTYHLDFHSWMPSKA